MTRPRRERRFRPGMVVRIVEDCREEPTATRKLATYLGLYEYGTDHRYVGPRAALHGNLKLRLEDGSVVWGVECWWIPEREAVALEAARARLSPAERLLLDACRDLTEQFCRSVNPCLEVEGLQAVPAYVAEGVEP